jgi:hypothetical protein
MTMPPCINCGEPGESHEWKVARRRGRCPIGGMKYRPRTDKPKPVSKVIGRAIYKKRNH